MTSASIGGYEPPQGHGDPGAYETDEPDTGSTTDVAKDQAAQVGQSAKESGKQVASTAKDEASNVTAEARRQAKDLGNEVSSQAQQQAAAQKDKAASGLHALGEELRSMAQQGGQTGPVTDLAHQAADKVTDLATWLEHRDPGSLLDEVRSYARRKPGTFLLGAATAGIVAGRLTRGAIQANQDTASGVVGGTL
jgi:vacuolar-type H+-ATPase subunit H